MEDLPALVRRLERLMGEVDRLEPDTRDTVLELLDGLDALHRTALRRLAADLGDATLGAARSRDPAVDWLLDAYGIGRDHRADAESALDEIRPYVHSHGGEIELLEVDAGTVRVRLAGSCSGCTASAITLEHGVEEALREHMPGFRRLVVEEDPDAEAHPPPGPTLVER